MSAQLLKAFTQASEAEDAAANAKRGANLMQPAPPAADLLRRVADNGCVMAAQNVDADGAASPTAAQTAAGTSPSIVVTASEWAALRGFLGKRVKNVLDVATAALRRQQDLVEDKTTEIYKAQVATLQDYVLDNETIVAEVGGWMTPMFTIQRLCEILTDPLRFNTSAAAGGDAFRLDASKDQVVAALAPVLRPDKLQAALRRCILVAPSQINIGEACI